MSSGGQIVGAIGGAVAGFILSAGNPLGAIKGAAYGAAIGGYIDPPPGPNLRGPTLEDKSFQSAAYGVSIPRLYGTIATMGNIIYLENNEYKAVSKKESQGGKGGGGGTYETTTYFATFAVALAESMPGSAIRRLWAGGKLIYSAGTDDLGTILQSQQSASNWKYYDGTQSESDPRMEGSLGVGNSPSYEGTAYIMFYDFDLTQYGNGLGGCPIKAEIVRQKAPGNPSVIRTFRTPYLLNSCGAGSALRNGKDWFVSQYVWPGLITEGELQYGSAYSNVIKIGAVGLPFTDGTLVNENPIYTLPGVNTHADWWRDFARGIGSSRERFVQSSSGDSFSLGPLSQDNTSRRVYSVCHVPGGLGFAGYFGFSPRSYCVFIGPVNAHKNFIMPAPKVPIFTFMDDGRLIIVDPTDVAPGVKPRAVNTYIYDNSTWQLQSSFMVTMKDYTWEQLSIIYRDGHVFLFSDVTKTGLDYRVFTQSGEHVRSGRLAFSGFDAEEDFYAAPVFGYTDELFCVSFRLLGGSTSVRSTVFVYFTLGVLNRAGVPLSEVVSDIVGTAGVFDLDVVALENQIVDGFRLSEPGSARAGVAPLQAAFLFDLIENGYSLRALRRGGEPKGFIERTVLGARPYGAAAGELISKQEEMSSQLPSLYAIKYLDYAREYDPGEQLATFPSPYVNRRDVEIPVVMSEESAAKLADIYVNLAWAERSTFRFTLPQSHYGIACGDLYEVEVSPGRFQRLRIDAVTHSYVGTIELTARSAEAAVYVSSARGAALPPPSEAIDYAGDSTVLLLDLPLLDDRLDLPSFIGAAWGDGSWPGSVLLRSADAGQTFTNIQSIYAKSTVAAARTVLAESSGFVIDRSSALVVSPIVGGFESITESQMLTGKNYAAYGADGRWEIIQFATVVPQQNGELKLTTLVRGLRGTEWASGLHRFGDYVVLLDDPDNVLITTDVGSLMVPMEFKAVTVGQSAGDIQAFNFSYKGVNLKPLSPVLAKKSPMGNDIQISWVARTRYTSSYWVTGAQPRNEDVMVWEVDIYNGANVVRRLNSSVESVIYTETQQLADFGILPTTLTVEIFQISSRVGRGYPLRITL